MTYSFGTTPVYVSEGQTVRFKFKAPSAWDYTLSVTVQIGDQQTVWYIITVPQDNAPDPFPFQPINDSEFDTQYVYGDGNRAGEQIVEVTGLTPETEVGVSLTSNIVAFTDEQCAARIMRVSQGESAWGSWYNPTNSAIVQNTDKIQVRLKTGTEQGFNYYLDLTIGARPERWNIFTKSAPPNFPEPFPDFTELYNKDLDVIVYSEVIQVLGLNDTAIVQTTNGVKIGISSTNNTTTNADGYDVLDGVTFVDSNTAPTIQNGQYLQLQMTTPNTANTTLESLLGIGDQTNGSTWGVTTGDLPETTPGNFSFTNQVDVDEDALVESNIVPAGGITGLGNTQYPSPPFTVPVELVSTDGSQPEIRIHYAEGGTSSWGVFPTEVNNGDQIQIRNKSSATYSQAIGTTIKVGTREILEWTITTNNGPDYNADFTPPSNLTNTAPSTSVVSQIIPITGINRPITITSSGGTGVLISIDFDTAVPGPRTFDPDVNSVIQIHQTTNGALSGVTSTTITVGTEATGGWSNTFVWTTTNYAVAPPPPELKGCWYSKKTAFVDMSSGAAQIREAKDDGYAIGTVVTILKDPVDATNPDPMQQYGDLKGNPAYAGGARLDARYPGYVDCDGSQYNVQDFPDLWCVIGNAYARPTDDTAQFGSWDPSLKQYSGKFRVPDYRNRKMAGPGPVDGNRGSSAILGIAPSTHPTKSFNATEAGGIGGYWYVDSVDVTTGDPNPYQQVIGDAGGTSGITSDFFSLGTPRTVISEEGIVIDIDFAITGSCTALVGPLTERIVQVPAHTHFVVTAQVDGDTGDPLIPWYIASNPGFIPYGFSDAQGASGASGVWIGDRLGRPANYINNADNDPNTWGLWDNSIITGGMPEGQYGGDSGRIGPTVPGTGYTTWFNDPGSDKDPENWGNQDDPNNITGEIRAIIDRYMPQFGVRWDEIDGGSYETLNDAISELYASIQTDSGAKTYSWSTLTANTWWASPGDMVADEYFVDTGHAVGSGYKNNAVYSELSSLRAGTSGATTAGTAGIVTGAGGSTVWNAMTLGIIDTRPGNARVASYSAPTIHEDSDTTQASHTHYLSKLIITNPEADFSYGNVSGAGWKNGIGGGGSMDSASESLNITFNQSAVGSEAGVGVELNTAQFRLNTSIKPVPTVEFHPNRTVPILEDFHKVKYIIKAF